MDYVWLVLLALLFSGVAIILLRLNEEEEKKPAPKKETAPGEETAPLPCQGSLGFALWLSAGDSRPPVGRTDRPAAQ